MGNMYTSKKRQSPVKKLFRGIAAFYLLPVIFVAVLCNTGFAQSGIIKGKVTDKDTKQPIPFTNVALLVSDTVAAGSTTDFDGIYIIYDVPPGAYDLKASFVGYKTLTVKDMVVKAGQTTFYDLELEVSAVSLETVEVVEYKIPLISKDKTTSGATVTSWEIQKMPNRNANAAATTVGGVYSVNPGKSTTTKPRSNQTVKDVTKVADPEPEPLHHLLTAGEINDFSKWKYWTGVASDELDGFRKAWGIHPQNRYCVQVMNENGFPLIGCKAVLMDESGNVLWTAMTDNTGKAELWKDIFSESGKKEKVKILLEKDGVYKTIEKPKKINKEVNTVVLDAPVDYSDKVDVMFTVDATGSMGDEIAYLKAELENIIDHFSVENPELELRLGSVFYRCFDNSYVTRKSDFSADISQTADFIKDQYAGEGGTEAVEEALGVSVEEMDWSKEARAKIMFIILDEPPGEDNEIKTVLKDQVAKAAAEGIRIVPVVASGMSAYESDKGLEYLMRSIALATNGTYVFLTDDSGIGNGHTKPSIDDYEVELLNDLIIRLLKQYTCVEPFHETDQEVVAVADSIKSIDEAEPVQNEEMKEEELTSTEPGPDRKFRVKAFPNPTSGRVTIEHGKKVREIFVTDLSGKILMRVEAERKQAAAIDLSSFPNGLYFLRYANVDHWEYVKVIVRH